MKRRALIGFDWLIGGLALVLAPVVWAQLTPGGMMKNFRAVDYDQNQIRSVFTGQSAKEVGNNQVFITGMRLEFYEYPKGRRTTNLVVEAPTCLLDRATQIASSPGHLDARRGDGQFTISGDGFEFRQKEGQLTLSNNVRNILLK